MDLSIHSPASASPRSRAAAGSSPRGSPRPAAPERAGPLTPRVWLPVVSDASCQFASFTVATWNILADGLTSEFSYANADAMAWARRGSQVLEEMIALDADIFSVQELVQYASFAELNRSHVFLFAPKLKSPALAGGGAGDGVALFVKRSRFELVDVGVHYFRAGAEWGAPLSNQNAIVATLRDRASGRLLVAAATHLKAGAAPADEEARCSQATQLAGLVRAAKLAAEAAGGGAPVPVVMGGDFNAAPGEKPWRTLLSIMPGLRSAYNHLARGEAALEALGLEAYAAGEPRFTTWKFRGHDAPKEKKVTEDYLFFDAKALRVVTLKALPTEEKCGAHGLPADHFPSDHLPLAAQFEFL
jgi:mRNA deadenylase 3'-5' endonuclease subunit Ccr4